MRILATALACCVALALAAPSRAADAKNAKDAKTSKEKIVGVWEVVKSEDAPPGATVEFTKDGKMIVTVKKDNQTEKIEGTYSVDGDSLTSVLKAEGQEHKQTVTIKKVTDKELLVEETNKDGKKMTHEFKKK